VRFRPRRLVARIHPKQQQALACGFDHAVWLLPVPGAQAGVGRKGLLAQRRRLFWREVHAVVVLGVVLEPGGTQAIEQAEVRRLGGLPPSLFTTRPYPY